MRSAPPTPRLKGKREHVGAGVEGHAGRVIGRTVVDDEDVEVGQLRADLRQHRGQRGLLVVRRDDHERPHEPGSLRPGHRCDDHPTAALQKRRVASAGSRTRRRPAAATLIVDGRPATNAACNEVPPGHERRRRDVVGAPVRARDEPERDQPSFRRGHHDATPAGHVEAHDRVRATGRGLGALTRARSDERVVDRGQGRRRPVRAVRAGRRRRPADASVPRRAPRESP